MSKFSIGDIVSLRTHPYQEISSKIIISGEHLMTPPTMIISEIISRTEGELPDIQTRYKCLWFSSKKNDFPEHWFAESDLRVLNFEHIDEPTTVITGKVVSLKNLRVEMGKRRSFLQIESKLTGGKTQTSSMSAHMIFISPVMLVIDVFNFDPTKLLKGVSKKNKIFPAQLAKCKYYNAAQEKYSEVILPIEAIVVLPEVADTLIESLSEAIKQSSYLLTETSIFKPINIYCKSGIYSLSAYNLVNLQNEDIELHRFGEFKVISSPYLQTAPSFQVETEDGSRILKNSVTPEQLIKTASEEVHKKYLQIKYCDKFGNHTHRTIDSYEVLLGPSDESETAPIFFLRAYCNLRKAIRHFRIDNILEVYMLVLESPTRSL